MPVPPSPKSHAIDGGPDHRSVAAADIATDAPAVPVAGTATS